MSLKQKYKDWLLVVLVTLSILTVVPFARIIQKLVSSTLGRATFGFLVLGALSGVIVFLVRYLWIRLEIRKLRLYFFLFIIAAIYFVATLNLWNAPEEAIHFLEYGLLSGAFYRAFRHHLSDWGIHGASLFSGGLVSFADELFQWVLPNRIWDLRDVGLNLFSCFLVQLGLWLIIRQLSPQDWTRLSAKSLRLISLLLGANLLIFGVTFSLTPHRLHQLTQVFPWLSFLEKEESLGGVLYRHKDEAIGVFYSRLTIDQLQRLDALKAQEYGQILWEWKNKSYQDFLKTFSASWYPFLYEMRVRLFRRDRHLELGLKATSQQEKRDRLFIAFKENQILQKYFRQTLRFSPFSWSQEKEQQIMAAINPSLPYKSPVGQKFLGTTSEKTIWSLIVTLLVLLIFINLFYKPKAEALNSSEKHSPNREGKNKKNVG
ncbi:VanZ family protein [Candidatus Aminicenantes bacterium AC-334-K16]|jgi:uncharacterized integral membrane protein|nr:VanZ family protein [Candidatus Aminicenantes bacterium AC-334-K16]